VVQRLCDERADLVPYLTRIVDSLERHGGLYSAKLAESVPVDVIEELNDWLKGHRRNSNAEPGAQNDPCEGLEAALEVLERIFPEYADELTR
ncbi:MAG TPA: hypothetical protein VGX03_04370, partial [Candidatus Binatia bacterium]|nr:hypothetical protein [Candidatus Binatia bacterium]